MRFAAAMIANNALAQDSGQLTSVEYIDACTEQEAQTLALHKCYERWPVNAGYIHQHAVLTEIKPDEHATVPLVEVETLTIEDVRATLQQLADYSSGQIQINRDNARSSMDMSIAMRHALIAFRAEAQLDQTFDIADVLGIKLSRGSE